MVHDYNYFFDNNDKSLFNFKVIRFDGNEIGKTLRIFHCSLLQ